MGNSGGAGNNIGGGSNKSTTHVDGIKQQEVGASGLGGSSGVGTMLRSA